MKQYKDPVTGDQLTLGEYISWKVQGVIRRWYFLIAISIVTIIVWATNNDVALLWWNLGASYLALFIESIVGLAMFNQTKRDAVILREVREISQHVNIAVEKSSIIHQQTYELAQKIDMIVEREEKEIEEIEHIMKGREV